MSIASEGWCMPKFDLSQLPPVDPPPPCEGKHRWERATASGCSQCCVHGPLVRQLECEDYACGAVVAQDTEGFEELWEAAPFN